MATYVHYNADHPDVEGFYTPYFGRLSDQELAIVADAHDRDLLHFATQLERNRADIDTYEADWCACAGPGGDAFATHFAEKLLAHHRHMLGRTLVDIETTSRIIAVCAAEIARRA